MARSNTAGPDGLCLVDKASGMTSHDVVAMARRHFGTRKIGHAGTLDPMATGLLVLGVGRATRLLTFVTGVDKTYEAAIRFGVETDSLDADGEVTVTHDMEAPDPAALAEAAASLTGDLLQVPPMVSAVKVDGRRLHQLAREGIEVERKARPVTVSQFDLTPGTDPMTWHAVITCSSGTYVRVLAADLGTALGGGAHLVGLRRTSVGPFRLSAAAPLESATLRPMRDAVAHLPQAVVDDDLARRIAVGAVLPADAFDLSDESELEGPIAVSDAAGELLAVYVAHGEGRLKPAVVIAAAG